MSIDDLSHAIFGASDQTTGITPPAPQTGTLTTTGTTTGVNAPPSPYVMLPSSALPVVASGWVSVDPRRRELADSILLTLLENYPDATAAAAAIRCSAKDLAKRAFEMADAMIDMEKA